MMRIFVAGGVTSNLFSALLPSFLASEHCIFATVREETDQERVNILTKYGVRFIDKSESLRQHFHAVLWMSTHDDIEYLSCLAQKYPTLAISSAAIMDFYLGKETETQLNPYKQSKLALSRIPAITTLIPGFYIEDIETPTWASKGLHGDTTIKLFGKYDSTFDWNKAYSVTPKTVMVTVINEWLKHPDTFPKNEPVIVCSDRIYRRWELRQLAGLGIDTVACLPPNDEAIYAEFTHATREDGTPIIISEQVVTMACRK